MEFTTKEVIAAILPTIPTADLIAEMKRRRPCESCEHSKLLSFCGHCLGCVWPILGKDNYKPRPTTEPLPDQTKGEGL